MRLPGISDEVEPVRSFDQFHAGLRVVEYPCRYCGDAHRHWLGNPGSGETVNAHGGSLGETRYFDILSTDDCNRDLDPVLSERMVRKGVVFMVVDPLLASAQPTAARKRQPVRP